MIMPGNRKFNPLILLTAFALLVSACSSSPPEGGNPDIYFVLFDALRADHMGAYGYGKPTTPSMDLLAGDSVLFEDSSSASVSTSLSIPKLFSGTSNLQKHLQWMPLWQTAAMSYPKGVTLLPADLREAGYHTIVITAHRGILGTDLDGGFDEQYYVPPTTGSYASAGEVSEVLEEVAARKYDKPIFVYIHAMDTHFPHPRNKYFEQFSSNPNFESKIMKPGGNPYVESGVPLSDREKEHLKALYDCNLRLGDDLIRDLAGMLKASGKYDDSVILVTADHGDVLGEGKENHYIGHAGTAWQAQIHVPLMIKLPGNRLAGSRVKFPVGAIDVKPTLLTLALGPEAIKDKVVGGLALIRKGRVIEEPDRILPIHGGFRFRRLKVLNSGPSLYCLDSDPGEEENLLAGGWPEQWPKEFTPFDKGVRHGNLEIQRKPRGITAFFLRDDPNRQQNLFEFRGLWLEKPGYSYPTRPFYVWLGNSSTNLESPETVLDLTDVNIKTLDPEQTSKTPEWIDGKWSLSRNWMWHSPDEDPGEAVFSVDMNSALDGEYGVSIMMTPVEYKAGSASAVKVSMGGRNWMTVSTMKPSSKEYPSVGSALEIPLGTMNVADGRIEIHLRPEKTMKTKEPGDRQLSPVPEDKRHWALIYAFKFTPLSKGAPSMTDVEQAERLEQLRGLGYIQ